MKSLEERAHDFARKVYTNGQEWWEDSSSIIALGKSCYIKGAEWMLAKATAWIANQGSKDNDGVVMICVEDFVKAMEEE